MLISVRHRDGLTLVEMLIAMTIGGLVLSIVASVSLRQQRVFGEIGERNAVRAQLREGGAVVPMDLRSASALLDDVREARDTSLELRATIASGVVCETTAGAVIAMPAIGGVTALSGFQTAPAAGDTAWILGDASTDVWTAHRITIASTVAGGHCATGGPVVSDSVAASPRLSFTLADTAFGGAIGLPFRVTRPVRYSVYRASDGSWYLGQKDWNAGLNRFNTIQPIAGPFLPPGTQGAAFSYADSAGNALATPVASLSTIALVRIELRGETRATATKRRDSAIVVVALRNRR